MSDLCTPWAADSLAGELLDAMAVPAWLHRAGAPLRSNPALQRLCGLDGPTLQGTALLDMVRADDREALQRATDDCLQGSGEPSAQSVQLLTGNGSERPVELTLRRVNWAGQAAALVTCIDLSDFQHVQNMMLGMSSMLRQIVDGAPVASYVIDRNHRVSHWNTACERLTGRSADDMVGSTTHWEAFFSRERPLLADSLVDGRDPAAVMAGLGEQACPSALVQGAYEQELWFDALGGEGRWISFTAAPLHEASGQVMGAIVTLQDVTQRRRTEAELTRRLEQMVEDRSAELAASARAMDAFIDNAPIGVVYARGRQVLRSNRCMVDIFGPAEPSGTDTRHQIEPDYHRDDADLAALREAWRPGLALGEPLHHELQMRHASGRLLWVQVNAYAVDPQHPQTGTWWMLQDRSEVRAAQEELHARFAELEATNQKLGQAQNQLLQSDKMASIGQLAAGVAHEINNPVGFVSSNLHTLRQYIDALMSLVDAFAAAQAAPADDAALARLRQVRQAVELDYLKEDLPQLLDESADGLARVKKIVQDLKDFSRVDQADWQQADLNAGLESTLNVVRHEVKYKAEVVKRLDPLPLVMCLAGQLNQVFMNLIVNASHAIAGQGTITLSSGVQDDWVWVQVDDTGCGMPESVSRRIFEPFFTTKDVGKGTGLGLSLSFSIVQRHGGSIQVRSVVGQGSAFRMWVPIAGPSAASGRPTGVPPAWA